MKKKLNTILIAIAVTAIILVGCAPEDFTPRPIEPTFAAPRTAAKPTSTSVTRTAIEPTAAPAPAPLAPAAARPNLVLPVVNPAGSPPPATPTMALPPYPRLPPLCETDKEAAFWAVIVMRYKWKQEHGGSLIGLGEMKVKVCGNREIKVAQIADWAEFENRNVFVLPQNFTWKKCCEEVANALSAALARWKQSRSTIWMPVGFYGEHWEYMDRVCGSRRPTIQELLDILADQGCRAQGYVVETVGNETMVRMPNHLAETVAVVLATGGTAYVIYRGAKLVAAVIIVGGSGGLGTPVAVLVAVTP